VLLEDARRDGVTKQVLLAAYPALRAEDLVSAGITHLLTPPKWIADSREPDGKVALFYSNENIALLVVVELRNLGHD